MLKRNAEFVTVTEKADGGLGNFTMRNIFASEAELPAHMRLACEVLIQPGEECKSHIHAGDTEIYYILSGRAEYEGAEGKNVLEPGDATVCYDGESHAIRCLGDKALNFLAFIPYTK
jgi:mannose-6-phosphate isomerase-like protein (cupin superfamily)